MFLNIDFITVSPIYMALLLRKVAVAPSLNDAISSTQTTSAQCTESTACPGHFTRSRKLTRNLDSMNFKLKNKGIQHLP